MPPATQEDIVLGPERCGEESKGWDRPENRDRPNNGGGKFAREELASRIVIGDLGGLVNLGVLLRSIAEDAHYAIDLSRRRF